MKVCFIGLGSIGSRHLANFVEVSEELGIETIVHALRTGKNPAQTESAHHVGRTVYEYHDLDTQYDAIFISNPTHRHEETLRKVAGRSTHFFVEKPIFDHSDVDLGTLGIPPDTVIYVAAPLRYTGVYKEIKTLISSERILSARAISSSYLPDWRPNSDYRDSYSASAERGGGVHLDLVHEWDYLIDLFGLPSVCYKIGAKVSDLEIESHDIALYVARSRNTLVELHLDYFGRIPRRTLELLTPDRLITADFIERSIRFSDQSKEINLSEDHNDMYREEMKTFLRMVLFGNENPNTIAKALEVLRVAELKINDKTGDFR